MNVTEKKELVEQFARFLDAQTTEITVRKTTCGSLPGDSFEIGDVIDFTLITGEKVSAMAMRKESDGMLFVFVDCLADEQPMFTSIRDEKIDYLHSELRRKLNSEIFEAFPNGIKSRMKEMQNGDKLRLLTKEEVFGDEALEPMKVTRNRIAFIGKDTDEWGWWWLQDKIENTTSIFANVDTNGTADDDYDCNSYGVRPAFKI